METKSLYTILDVRPDASQDQIETAYAEALHRLKDGTDPNPNADDRIRLIAAKEAYAILSNPVTRQQYNQKLFAPQTFDGQAQIVIEQSDSWNLSKLFAIGLILLAAIGLYNYNDTQREKLRIAHEKEVAATQARLEQEKLNQQEAEQQAQLQQQNDREKEALERMTRENAIRESRDLDNRLRQEAMERQRQEQFQQQREEAQRRQQLAEAQQRTQREKQALQWLENENRRRY